MFKIKNIIENKIVFEGNGAEFTHFMRKIAVENDDKELSITVFGEALDYLKNYCSNLAFVRKTTLQVTVSIEVETHFDVQTTIDNFSSEVDYEFKSIDGIEVLKTEILEVE